MIGGPLRVAPEMLAQARTYWLPVRARHWIATGGIIRAIPVQSGDRQRLAGPFGTQIMDLD